MAPALSAFDAVRARIASAVRGPAKTVAIGAFTLRAAQRESVRAIEQALQRFGGALVTDAPGSGKTVLALAVAAAYRDVLVVAPAAVRAQWQRAAAQTGIALRIVTQEALSRRAACNPAALIVVDEAHHFRHTHTARYRALTELAIGARILLLTATPVVNRTRERDALLALFLGAAPPDANTLAQVLLRRDTGSVTHTPVRLAPLASAADVPGVAALLEALPPPLPTSDGLTATALIRTSLAMAWSSSLAALDAALRRRLQRGAVIADGLREGRWPSRDALRDWIIGEGATQLALPLALANIAAEPPLDAERTLASHLDAIAELRQLIAAHVTHDTGTRAAALRRLLDDELPRRIVLLAHHQETVGALYAELRDVPGVVAITGMRVRAAAGRWTRDDVLRRLGPDAKPWTPDDIRDIRLLLATDILAEGVELQGCATLVHGDPAWTPARLEQRVGRIAREGQRAPVHVTAFALPKGAEHLLGLQGRLSEKRRARREALAPATAARTLLRALEAWPTVPDPSSDDTGPCVAACEATNDGFLAVVSVGDRDILLGGHREERRWRIGTAAPRLTELVAAVRGPAALHASDAREARRLIQRWLQRERSRNAVHHARGLDPALLRRAHHRMDRWMGARPLAARADAIARIGKLRAALGHIHGIGAERMLRAALALEDDDLCMERLDAMAAPHEHAPHEAQHPTLSALLILRRRSPDVPAPPAPSTGTAAPR